ncbi:phage tail protein I [Pseudoalteromonas piscicida]|uniref:phage tail protein I n=1 Tax=Pseudoalteromonas piscicida TaxID=43662 RepID=UPI0005F9E2DC|nr:phage tail protein I [Pseudoalteromonas piscicida]KJY96095.1 tail formation protein [Pseudoalteromonas piscicida]
MTSYHKLLPPGTSKLVRNIAEQVEDLPSKLEVTPTIPEYVGKQWHPQTCPEALLPWLAWSLSVDEWDESWPVDTKRAFIANSVKVHKHKGTVGSVKRALAALGVSVEFFEWFQEIDDIALAPYQSKQPHTFMFIAWANEIPYTSDAVILSPELYQAVKDVTDSTKPKRAHFDFLVGAKMSLKLQTASIASGLQVARKSAQTEAVKASGATVAAAFALASNKQIAATGRYMKSQHVNAYLQSSARVGLHLNNRRHVVSRIYLTNEQRLPAAKFDFTTELASTLHFTNRRFQVARFYCHTYTNLS